MIIICEGPDNTGKDTQITLLQPYLIDKPMHVLHYSGLQGFKTKKQSKEYSKKMYENMFLIIDKFHDTNHFILNRSHIGENVYSPMYRNYNASYIFKLEKTFSKHDFWRDISLITFIDGSENLINRDDGLSFSTKKNDKYEEIDRFIKTTKKSKIQNKLILNINNKSIDQVHIEILDFLRLQHE